MNSAKPEFELRQWTLGQILDHAIARFPDQEALVYADRDYRLTWAELGQLVDSFARGLMALGVQKGEKVAIWAANIPWWVAIQFATAKIGAILLPINTNYRQHELRYVLEQSGCENLFLMDSIRDHCLVDSLLAIAPEIHKQPRAALDCEALPKLRRVFYLGAEKHRGMYSVPELLAMAEMTDQADYDSRQASLSPWDAINMQYTSGTTGFPKGVLLTHVGIGLNGWWIGQNQAFTARDRVCLPVPLFHCFGCVLGVLACVNHGACMVILETFNPAHVLTAIHKERCTALYGVPTMFLAELEHRSFDSARMKSLRTGIMAGSICPEPLMRRVVEDMHMGEITICYGLTEASPVITQSHISDPLTSRCQSVGKTLPGVEMRVINPESGEDAPTGASGEIVCRGYNVMQGYYKMAEETARAIDAQGWLHTGDLGRLDACGYLYITGRMKDMIIRGGENIYPREIEEFLLSMPGVLDVQVVGCPSRKYGEEVAAFFLVRDNCVISAKTVREFCRGEIAWFKIPKHVAVLDKYPLTASGKIQKYRLRQMAGERWGERGNEHE